MAPLFFLLLFAIIEGGRFIVYYETLNNATREGARYAIVHGSNSSLPERTDAAGTSPPAATTPRARTSSNGSRTRPSGCSARTSSVDADLGPARQRPRGRRQRVAATYTYHAIVPIVPLPPITISAESTLVINN